MNRNKLIAQNRWKNVRKKIRKYISENSEKTKVNKSRILGYLAGDGSVFRYIDRNNEEYFGISFFPDNLCVAKTYVDDMSKVYGVVLKIKEEKNHYNISIKNRVIYKELMSIGSYGSFTKNQLIQHVTDDDEIGRQVMKMHIRFIRAQANGQLVDALNSVADE